jgi:hypothetical protein
MRARKMLKGKRLVVLAVILMTAALFLMLSAAKPIVGAASADAESSEVTLVVRPLVIMNYSAVSGEEFSISINATMVGTISLQKNFTMRLSYDPALVECTGFERGDLFQGSDATYNFAPNNTEGNVYVAVNFTSTVDGNGSLALLTFQVKGTGETSLHLYDVFLYDSEGAVLQYTAYDGYFNNKVNFDFTMPLTLLAVTFVSLLLNQKIESKMKSVLEDREFRVRDAVLLVGLIVVVITVIVVVRQLSMILMVLFLFSYSVLLFTFGYLVSRKRWYLGILPPAVFILLYAFLRETSVWIYYLSNIYGLIFAVLITLYLAGLFDWKTTAVFGALITAMDIVLVLVTRTMVQAASAAVSLSLPVLVSLPLVPLIRTGTGLLILSLGLGDFFFAGLLAIQTFKKYGRRLTIVSVAGMTISFFIFEAFILTFRIGAFPGTLMIICGWLPVVLVPTLRNWRKASGPSLEKVASG